MRRKNVQERPFDLDDELHPSVPRENDPEVKLSQTLGPFKRDGEEYSAQEEAILPADRLFEALATEYRARV
jgi:hypothetical protein